MCLCLVLYHGVWHCWWGKNIHIKRDESPSVYPPPLCDWLVYKLVVQKSTLKRLALYIHTYTPGTPQTYGTLLTVIGGTVARTQWAQKTHRYHGTAWPLRATCSRFGAHIISHVSRLQFSRKGKHCCYLSSHQSFAVARAPLVARRIKIHSRTCRDVTFQPTPHTKGPSTPHLPYVKFCP